MSTVEEICRGIGTNIGDVLSDWQALVGARPWLDLPADVDIDHLPQLVRAVVAAAISRADQEDPRTAVLRFALQHGFHRREEGYEDHVLFQEFHLLREAIWEGVQRRHGREPERFPAIGRIDMVITAATRGSLHGYHEEPGEGRLETLARELASTCYWPPELRPSERS